MSEKNKINTVIETAMKNLNSLIDVNTVMGKPIKMENGTTVIPVSKVTMGFMSGGGEYGEIKLLKKNNDLPFAGGSGAIVSLKPVGFLIEEGEKYKLLAFATDNYEKFINSATSFIEKLKENN